MRCLSTTLASLQRLASKKGGGKPSGKPFSYQCIVQSFVTKIILGLILTTFESSTICEAAGIIVNFGSSLKPNHLEHLSKSVKRSTAGVGNSF